VKYRYTDRELESIVESIVVLTDTREQKNQHILDWLDKFEHKSGAVGIKHRAKKLTSGDYSFYIPRQDSLGIMGDIYFDNQFIIERKKDLDELSGNLTTNRERFANEFTRHPAKRFHLIVEGGSYNDIYDFKYGFHNQRGGIRPNVYMANLLAFQSRYNINAYFVSKKHSPELLWGLIRNHALRYFEDEGGG
jgi:ERCC4-type nuclease